jgi:hypothetical protein
VLGLDLFFKENTTTTNGTSVMPHSSQWSIVMFFHEDN